MQQLHSDLLVADTPLRFLGLEIGARMTVVRLPGSKLLLHSPIAATAELVREVTALGRVAYLVAPNRFHHLFVGEWKEACPDASIYVAPGLDTKRADLSIAGILTDEPDVVGSHHRTAGVHGQLQGQVDIAFFVWSSYPL